MADEREEQKFLESLTKEELVAKVLELQRERNQILLKTSEDHGAKEPDATFTDSSCTPGKSKQSKKQNRQFDFSKYNKRHVALMIAYLGWDMHGFAIQENISTTIEAYLFDALIKARLVEGREGSNYSRCGRTDKGVSAFRQVVSLDVRSNLCEGVGIIQSDGFVKDGKGIATKELPYVQILNNLLPNEIRVLSWAPVEPAFDARFSCTNRKYKYYFPLADLDLELMNNAAKKLEGDHDFRNFCKMDVANGVMQFKRTITSFDIKKVQNENMFLKSQEDAPVLEPSGYQMCEAVICGSAFLWHQVRCVMSVVLMIGQGLESPEIIDWLLDMNNCPQRPQYNMAVEFPLVLYDCAFEDIPWVFEPNVIQSLIKHLQKLWTVHAVRATMLKELLILINDVSKSGSDDSAECITATSIDIGQNGCNQTSFLVPGESHKTHKLLKKRAVCESFEQKLENINSKRKKRGKEVLKPEIDKN